jgi:hypothetical protein
MLLILMVNVARYMPELAVIVFRMEKDWSVLSI